jgi:hypothetical protein
MKKPVKLLIAYVVSFLVFCAIIVLGLVLYMQKNTPDSMSYYDNLCNSHSYVKEIRDVACIIRDQYKNYTRTDTARVFVNATDLDLKVLQYNYYNYPASSNPPSCCGVDQKIYFQYKNQYLGNIQNDNSDLGSEISLQENDKYIFFYINTGLDAGRKPVYIVNKNNNKIYYYYIDIPLTSKLKYDYVKFDLNTYKVSFYKDNQLILEADKISDFGFSDLNSNKYTSLDNLE